jgi:hypothetical protein
MIYWYKYIHIGTGNLGHLSTCFRKSATSADVSIRQHTSAHRAPIHLLPKVNRRHVPLVQLLVVPLASVSIRQHPSAYVSIRQQ